MFAILLFIVGLLAGVAAHQGGVCLVAATSELIHERRAARFFFIFAAMSVAFFIVVIAALLLPMDVHFAQSLHLGGFLIFGALVYGMGAALNGGCALGTLNKLFSGDLAFLGTLIGLGLGFSGFLFLLKGKLVSPPEMIMGADMRPVVLSFLLLAAIVGLSFLLTRGGGASHQAQKPDQGWPASFQKDRLAPLARSRQLRSIVLLGAASGLLYLLLGHGWDYSRLMMTALSAFVFDKPLEPAFTFILLPTLGLFTGMGAAALYSRHFQLKSPGVATLISKIFAGSLMGLSAGFLAGGNDTLLLYGMPSAALHAPIALLLIVIAIWVMLRLQQRFHR